MVFVPSFFITSFVSPYLQPYKVLFLFIQSRLVKWISSFKELISLLAFLRVLSVSKVTLSVIRVSTSLANLCSHTGHIPTSNRLFVKSSVSIKNHINSGLKLTLQCTITIPLTHDLSTLRSIFSST